MSQPEELTAAQVEQIGRLLAPLMKDALRSEFHKLRGDFTAALSEASLRHEHRAADLEGRVAALESVKAKALLAYGVIVAVAVWAYELAKSWLLGAISGHSR